MMQTKTGQAVIISDINEKVSGVLELIKEPLNEVVGAFSMRAESFCRSRLEIELKSHGKPTHMFENSTHGYGTKTYTVGDGELQNLQALQTDFTKARNKFRIMVQEETKSFAQCIKKLYQSTYTAYFAKPNPEIEGFQAVRERLDTLVYVLTDEFNYGVSQTLNIILEAEDEDKMINDATEAFRSIMHDVHEQLDDVETVQKGFAAKNIPIQLRQN